MAKFSSSADLEKWDSLEGASKSSFDKLLKGTASDADLTKMGKVASDFSELARSIFESGLTAIEERADYLDQQAQEKRAKSKKAELTPDELDNLHKSSKKRAMKELSPALLDTIEEIESSLQDVAQEVYDATTKNTSEFSKLHDFLTGKANNNPDNDLIINKPVKKLGLSPDFFTDSDESLTDSKEGSQETNSYDLLTKFVKSLAKDKLTSLTNSDSYINKFLKMFSSKNNVDDDLETSNKSSKKSKGYAASKISSSFSFSNKTDAMFESAFKSSSKANTDLDKYLDNKQYNEGKKSSISNKLSDDSWLTKVKRMFASSGKKPSGNSAFIDTLLSGLGLLIMSPQILTAFGDMVSKYFNWESIKTTLGLAFSSLTDKVSNIATSIIDKVKSFFGITTTKKKPVNTNVNDKAPQSLGRVNYKPIDATLSNEQLKAEGSAQIPLLLKDRKKFQDALDKNPNASNAKDMQANINDIDARLSTYNAASNGPSYANSTDNLINNSNSVVTNEAASNDILDSSSGDTAANYSASKSSVNDYSTSTGVSNTNYSSAGSNTQVSTLNNAPFTPGLALDNSEKDYFNLGNSIMNTNKPVVSSIPINLSTFSIKSSIDDRLNIVNAALMY